MPHNEYAKLLTPRSSFTALRLRVPARLEEAVPGVSCTQGHSKCQSNRGHCGTVLVPLGVCWMLPHMVGVLILATPETEMDTELLEAVPLLVCTTARDSSSPHQEM